jgi:hypothetical protein
MENFTMAELGVFIGVLGGVVTSIILTIQKSKCETITCCGVHCKRKIKEAVKGETGGLTGTLPSGLGETTRFDDLGSTTLGTPNSNP